MVANCLYNVTYHVTSEVKLITNHVLSRHLQHYVLMDFYLESIKLMTQLILHNNTRSIAITLFQFCSQFIPFHYYNYLVSIWNIHYSWTDFSFVQLIILVE